MPSDAPTARRGRPLDASREGPILAATIELLDERGYDRLTVKDIADRAGAGLGAIYRRWPTKSAVVVAALAATGRPDVPPVLSGDVADDLCRALMRDVELIGRHLPGFATALRHDPDLAAAVREAIVAPRQELIAGILGAAVADPAECTLRAEMALGLIVARLTLGLPLPDECELRERIVPVVLGRARRRRPAR